MQPRDDLATYVDCGAGAPERALWLAVIYQAITDVARWKTGSGGSLSKRAHDNALAWFGSPSFHGVCALAGVEGDRLLSVMDLSVERRRAGIGSRGRLAVHRAVA